MKIIILLVRIIILARRIAFRRIINLLITGITIFVRNIIILKRITVTGINFTI